MTGSGKMDVSSWLRSLGLERYEQAFRDNEIDASILPKLTGEDLKDLGVSAVGHRRRLLEAITQLREQEPAVTGTSAPHGEEPAPHHPAAAAAEGERRQVTVLFADLTGYTRLTSELGAEDMHELMGRFFGLLDRIIENYGGAIDKHIGDCVMAVFGAPVAHGNDPERAVRAALDIQRQVAALADELGRPMGVHAGIASGQVVAGADSRQEYTITGESVNLASRLTDEAASGEILISDAVHRALASQLECAEVGALKVKGLASSVTAWRLLGLRRSAEESGQPFVGRRSEVQQFEAALAGCWTSGCGQTVYVRGEAGIGKSRLVEEFKLAAARAGFSCHAGLVLDFGAGTGQDAIRALVRSLLGLVGAAGEQRPAAEAAASRAVDGGLVAAERRVFLNDLLDLPQPTDLRALYDAMDNAARNRGKRETVADLVRRASGQQPRLLVVEDLHWADRLTLDHLAGLTEAVADCPALLVMTSRIEGDPLDQAWRSGVAGCPLMTIDLGPLRPAEAETLAEVYLDALGDLAKRCIERAAGNPLFLEQLLRHAEESAEAGIPGSVQSLVQARMDRLSPEDKHALQSASVFGQRFSSDGLRFLMDNPAYDGASLVALFLVRPQAEDFLFAHALIRDAVYDSLLHSRRRELHRRAADWFAERDLSLHAEHLDRAEDQGAAPAYLAAARAQTADYHYERALRLVERGLTIAQARADLFALTCAQGELFHHLGSMPGSQRAYEAALEAASDGRERCQARLGLAAVKRVTDDLDGAFADLHEAEAAAVELDLTPELARVHFLRGNLFFPKGDIEGCLKEHERSLELARRAGSPELEAAALSGLGDAEYVRGRMITAHARFKECIDISREHGLGRIEVANLHMRGLTLLFQNELRAALEEVGAASHGAAKVGHHRAEVVARGIWGYLLVENAQWAAGRRQEELALQTARRLGARRFEPISLLYMALIAAARQRPAEASELAAEAVAISRETGITFTGPWALGALAVVTGDAGLRQRSLQEGESILSQGCVSHNHLWFYRYAIEACLNAGEWNGVELYSAALEHYTECEPLPWSAFFIARGRALATFGRGARDEATLGTLERLRADAERLGLKMALPALEKALDKTELRVSPGRTGTA